MSESEDNTYPLGDEGDQSIITLSAKYSELSELQQAYMSFVKGGGLFIPTGREFHLGDKVHVLVQLVDDTEKYSIEGRVIWITPVRAQSNRMAGIGVQLKGDKAEHLHNEIERKLAGSVNSYRATYTM